MSANLGHRLAKLSPQEIRALVKGLNRAPAAPQQMPRNSGQQYPLSAAQERIWFLCQLSPVSRAFNNPAAMRVRAQNPLDRAHLVAALAEISRRHEIFRTTFHLEAGKPVQIIHNELPLPLTWEDLRALTPADREAEARRIGIEEGCRAFDLAKGPLLALKFLRLDESEYLMLVTSHHIISDGWSNAQFARELSMLSDGAELAPVELQYIDYVAWESNWLASDAAQSQLDFWKSRIDTDLLPIELPTDRSRPTHASDAGGMETLTIPASTVDRLRGLARSEKTSLFPLVMTALAVLIHRLTGEACFVIGTITANRNQRAYQQVMGPLLNQLAILCEVPPDATTRTMLHLMKSACQEALRNQELPFNVLLNALKVRRDLGVHPLFQVMLVHQNVPAQYASAGMDVEVIKLDYGTTKLDLNFWIEEINDGLVVTLHYSCALFDRPTVRRLLSDYSRAAACVCDGLDTPITDLNLFADADPPAALRPTPPNEDILTRFAQQVERTPQAPAVIGEDGALTYAELDARTNCIAHRLLAEGASVEKPVALLTGRGCGTVVALLGILKAGAPYMPLDLAQPVVRHRAVMADADATLIVCDARTAEIASQLGAVCIRLDNIETAATTTPISSSPGAAAYLIYTSGTTGIPKGVCVEHRNIVTYSNAIWERMGLNACDLFASLSSIATDLGNTMIFPPLLNGGCVVLCPDDAIADPTLLAQFFERHPVACFKITPSHLHAIMLHPSLLPSKLLVLGGEVATPALIERIRSFAPGLRILNHYGPTETTVGVLTYEVPDPWLGGQIPLGSELGYADVRVLDTAGRPVPTGVIGELYIGGPTLTRGYWRAPALTDEKFVTAADGTRLYRTGDLGKHLANGTFSFHGRADRQIKIRGYRVEPGEVEAVLEKHPAVAHVSVRASTNGRLIGYVVALAPVEPITLISFLRESLPTPMIPSAIVLLKSFPRTAAGKIDHAALPEPPQLAIGPQSHPRDPLELELTHIWQDVLNLDAVGIYDSFFECGGHSLLAVKLMEQIKTHFGFELPLATHCTHDSVANFAVLLRRRCPVDTGPLVTIRSGAVQSPIAPSIACVHPAGGDVLCYYPLAQAFASTKLVYGLRAQPGDGSPSIQDLARRYVDVLPADPAPLLLGWSMGALVAFEMALQWEIRTGTALRVAILDQPAPHPTNLPPRDESDVGLMLAFAAKVSALVGSDIGIGPDQIDSDPEAKFLAAFQRHGLAPEDVQVDDFSHYLHLMLAHNHATAGYRPTAPYKGDVLVLRAEESLAVGGSEVVRSTDLGWQHWCSGKCTVVPVPGNHVTMMRTPNVTRIAKSLEQGWGLL